jgi:hypothetical protein
MMLNLSFPYGPDLAPFFLKFGFKTGCQGFAGPVPSAFHNKYFY